MKLYLVQHGDALAKALDPDRALSDQGKADMEKIARFLKGHVKPAIIVHSGKTRARQSADILAKTLAPDITPEAITGIAPNDSVQSFVHHARALRDDLLLVGHLPFVSKLVAQLSTNQANPFTTFQPGSMVCLAVEKDGDMDGNEGDSWQIQWMIRPELLPE